MKVYKVKQDCELNIMGRIKKLKKDEEIQESNYTKTYPKFFKEIGSIEYNGNLSKGIFVPIKEPIKAPIKKYIEEDKVEIEDELDIKPKKRKKKAKIVEIEDIAKDITIETEEDI